MFSVSPAIAWLIAGIAVLGAEIFLGTAYLLVVAFAFGATAAGAALGAMENGQRRREDARRFASFCAGAGAGGISARNKNQFWAKSFGFL